MNCVRKSIKVFAVSAVLFGGVGLSYLPAASATSGIVGDTVKQKSQAKQATETVTNKVAMCVFGLCVNTPSIFNVGTDLLKRQVYNSLAKTIGEKMPIASSAKEVFPTVDSLPGTPFQPTGNIQQIAQQIRSSNGSVMLQPGDYNIPIDVYCMKHNASSPNGHRYLLARLKGKMADVITALNSRSAGSDIPHSQLQVLSWNLQAGMKYQEMTPENRIIIDKLLPEYKQRLSRSYWEEILATWNQISSTVPGIPRFEDSLDKLGEVGKTIKTLRQVRSELTTYGNNYNSLFSAFITSNNSNESGGYENTPWSKISNRVYGRLVTQGNAGTPAELQLRVLPSSNVKTQVKAGCAEKSPVKTDITNLVADPKNSGIQPLSMSMKFSNSTSNTLTEPGELYASQLGKGQWHYVDRYFSSFSRNPDRSFWKASVYNTVNNNYQAYRDISQRHAFYDFVDAYLNTQAKTIKSKWFEAAALVTQLNAVGAADFVNLGYLDDNAEDFLRKGNEYLFPFNMANFRYLMKGDSIPGMKGLTGKALDYRLVEFEQSKIEEFIKGYTNCNASKDEIIEQVNKIFNASNVSYIPIKLLQPSIEGDVIKENFTDKGLKFDFRKYKDRVILGQRIVDKLYAKQ